MNTSEADPKRACDDPLRGKGQNAASPGRQLDARQAADWRLWRTLVETRAILGTTIARYFIFNAQSTATVLSRPIFFIATVQVTF